jgi:long-chain acyl-CoA synthetase
MGGFAGRPLPEYPLLVDPARISERTTVGVFFRQVERLGDRRFLRHHDGSEWCDLTWGEFADRVLRVATQLVLAGVEAGDRVALMSENCPEWLYCDLAIQAAGAVTVPIYPSTPAPVARTIVGNSEAVLGIVAGEQAASRLAPLRTARIDREIPVWLTGQPTPEALAEVEARCARLRPDDLATIV